MTKLTKGFIEKVQSPASGYKIYWDDVVKGYGLRVMPSGKRVFVAQGRVRGKAVIMTLGPYGLMTECDARERARRILQQMRDGTDPRVAKKADETARVSLLTVATEYINRPGKLKQSSRDTIERHVMTTFAAWKDKPIAGITEDECRRRYREMLTKGLRGKAPAPGQAAQSMSVLRALINFASRRYHRADGSPLIVNNPVDGLKDDWVALQPRTSRIPDGRVGAVWAALKEWREEACLRESRAGIDLVMFLMLAGCRLNEASRLTWDRVHIEDKAGNCFWHLPDPKNHHPFWFPLSTQAVDLLKTRPRGEESPFVFASRSKAGYIGNPRDLLAKISKMAGTKITAHDLRRTYTTIGIANCGIDFYKVELLTGHLPNGSVTARHYLETSHLDYLYPETQRISDWIEGMAAKANGENVVSLRA